jgi:hypothetical protein
MDETKIKPIRPYNIILVTQFGKEVGGNISTCGSVDLRILGIFLLEGSFKLLEVAS